MDWMGRALFQRGARSERQLCARKERNLTGFTLNTTQKTVPWQGVNEVTIFEVGDPNESPWVLDKLTRNLAAIRGSNIDAREQAV
jgi:hypothetical protein